MDGPKNMCACALCHDACSIIVFIMSVGHIAEKLQANKPSKDGIMNQVSNPEITSRKHGSDFRAENSISGGLSCCQTSFDISCSWLT